MRTVTSVTACAQVLVNSLSNVVTSKGSIFPVSFVAIFALAVLGGQSYQGVTLSCSDPSVASRAECVNSSSYNGAPREWRDWRLGYSWVSHVFTHA